MEILKLGNVIEFKSGTSNLPKDYKIDGDIPFINYKDVYLARPIQIETLKKIKVFKNDNYEKNMANFNDLIMTSSSETSIDNGMISIYTGENPVLVNGFCKILKINNEKIINKYLFYLFNNKKYRKLISNCSNGITRHNILWYLFKKIDILIPNIDEQKAIIDIIEPFELKLKQIKNKLTYIKNITNRIINYDYKVINLFKDEEILFSKGINFKKGMISEKKTDLLFINVAAINNNPNKYINKEFSNLKNVQIGDVILSLDGNTGLVNNFLTGINGYGYKIISNKYSNFQLYYSLLAKINQDIIKQNSHGTTIQHASKAKDRILLLDFNKSNLLELFYELDIKYKQIYETLTKIINLLIEKYVH